MAVLGMLANEVQSGRLGIDRAPSTFQIELGRFPFYDFEFGV